MNFRTTLILGVLAVAALVFVLVVQHNTPADDKSKDVVYEPGKARKLFDTKVADVTRLTVTTGDNPPVVLTKEGKGDWRLTQPVDWPADSTQVDLLLGQVLDVKSRGRPESKGATAATTGLDKPRYKIEWADANGHTGTLLIGKRGPGWVYVSTGDPAAVELGPGNVVPAVLEEGADDLAATLRSKSLVRIKSGDVRQVEITRAAGGANGGADGDAAEKVVLQREEGHWKVVAPAAVSADDEEVRGLIDSVTGLTAVQFLGGKSAAPPAAPARLDRPVVTVTLDTAAASPTTQPAGATRPAGEKAGKAGRSVTVAFARPSEQNVYVKLSDPPVAAKASMTSQEFTRLAEASPLTLRDRRVVSVDPAAVTGFTLLEEKPRPEPVARPRPPRRHAADAARDPVGRAGRPARVADRALQGERRGSRHGAGRSDDPAVHRARGR